ncbi:hypothetical protein FOVG_02028 [Fusarium oxysporum f. sp. pisi HDV247]|nr:hypothetical protein FOVG_02028 [Fusarium oxysporum f. sp. pisi HDV247]
MQSKLAIVAKERGPGKLLNSEVNTIYTSRSLQQLFVNKVIVRWRESIISNPKKSQTRIPASNPEPDSCLSLTVPIIKIESPETTSSQANQPYLKFISSTVLSQLPESSSWVYVPTRRTNQIFLLAQRRENAAHAALVVGARLWDGTWRA